MSEPLYLTRYDGYYEMNRVPDGEWCKADDALAIAAERDQLQAELATAKARIAELNQYIIQIEKIAGDNAVNLGISMSNVDRLEAQLARTWQPVEVTSPEINALIPFGLRLCRQQEPTE